MKYEWKDLPKPMSCFTVRNATMRNLNTGEVVQHYSANTKIMVVQKCITPTNTFYRTESARHHYLNYAFEASAFGLPNESAPSVPPTPFIDRNAKPVTRTLAPARKQKSAKVVVLPEDGETRQHRGWLSRLFRRKNG